MKSTFSHLKHGAGAEACANNISDSLEHEPNSMHMHWLTFAASMLSSWTLGPSSFLVVVFSTRTGADMVSARCQ